MTASPIRCWLVERTVDQRNLVTIVYATPDGERYHQRERSAVALRNGAPVTAAVTVDPDDLEPVSDAETRERYEREAARTADRYDPDDPI